MDALQFERASPAVGSTGLFGMVSFSPVTLAEANVMLDMWGHKMGRLHRGNQGAWCHALTHEGQAVGIVTTSMLIMPRVGGAGWLTRDNCVELSRLAASRGFEALAGVCVPFARLPVGSLILERDPSRGIVSLRWLAKDRAIPFRDRHSIRQAGTE